MYSSEQYDFTILEPASGEDNRDTEVFTSFYQRLYQKIIRKNKEVFQMHIFKRKMRKYRIGNSLRILDKTGKRIILPYTLKELASMDKNQLNEYMNSIIQKEHINILTAEEKLRKYIPSENLVNEKFLMYLYIKEILEKVMRMHSIARKRIKIIVIDSKELQTEYLLNEIKEDLNYLTLVTDRPEYFKTYIENLYEESGLLISLINKPLSSPVEGNIIINLDNKQDKNYRYFEEKGVYIDLSEISVDMNYIVAKRDDITYYNHMIVLINGEIVNNSIVQGALCGKLPDISLENIEKFEKYEELKIANLVCKY